MTIIIPKPNRPRKKRSMPVSKFLMLYRKPFEYLQEGLFTEDDFMDILEKDCPGMTLKQAKLLLTGKSVEV